MREADRVHRRVTGDETGRAALFTATSTKRGELAQTFINFPPMQKGASFNMEALRQQIEAAQGNFLSH